MKRSKNRLTQAYLWGGTREWLLTVLYGRQEVEKRGGTKAILLYTLRIGALEQVERREPKLVTIIAGKPKARQPTECPIVCCL